MKIADVIFKLMRSITGQSHWSVAVEGGGAPLIQHATYAKARREACRLMIQTGRRVQILFVVGDVVPWGGAHGQFRAKKALVRNFVTGKNLKTDNPWALKDDAP
jgi:hypothetical protein